MEDSERLPAQGPLGKCMSGRVTWCVCDMVSAAASRISMGSPGFCGVSEPWGDQSSGS